MSNIHSITSHMGKTEASLCADVVQFLELWLEKSRASLSRDHLKAAERDGR